MNPPDHPTPTQPTDTPRTDAVDFEDAGLRVVKANFARRLERELAVADVAYQRACEVEHELRAEVERLKGGRMAAERIMTDVAEAAEELAIARAEKAEAAETVALAKWNGALERAMRAEAERDALAKDRERLDWLGRRHFTGLTPSLLDEELPAFISPRATKSPYIRDAIDAAMIMPSQP